MCAGACCIVHSTPSARLAELADQPLDVTLPARADKPPGQRPQVHAALVLHLVAEADGAGGQLGPVFDKRGRMVTLRRGSSSCSVRCRRGRELTRGQIGGPLGLENKLVGYVFLIDQNLKVRWAGCGPATAEEVDHLRKGTAVLMRRASEHAATG
jgi:hypothetical protein